MSLGSLGGIVVRHTDKNRSSIRFKRNALAFGPLLGLLIGAAQAADQQAFHIQAGPLDEVLLNISRQSGQVISFSPEVERLSLIHISEPTRPRFGSRMPSSA